MNQRRRGYRAPSDYNPNRGKSSGRRGRPGGRFGDERQSGAADSPERPRRDSDPRAGQDRGADRRGTARRDGRDAGREPSRETGRLDRARRDPRDRGAARSERPDRGTEGSRDRGSGHGSGRQRESHRDAAAQSGAARVFSFDADGMPRGGAPDDGRPRSERPRSERPHREHGESRGHRPQVTDQRSQERREPPQRAAKEHSVSFERLEAKRTSAEDVRGLGFADLGLGGNIVRALSELGAERPFPIQAATIPDAVEGRHLLGRARTGSGKTIAFGAALVERILKLKAEGVFRPDPPKQRRERGVAQKRQKGEKPSVRAPKALILAPTRELALQIDRTVQPIARSVGLYTGQFVGGSPFEPQLHALQRGVDIVIGTPGRIEDLAQRGILELRDVHVTVLDEADHMCELGFLEPVQRILRRTERGGQRLLFSATLDWGVRDLVDEFLRNPAVHEIAEDAEVQGDVTHRVLVVLREDKDAALVELARRGDRVIVFCRTRAYVDRLAELFAEAGIRVTALHGDLAQAKRERNLQRFAEGKVPVLVATDVAARGLHVDDVDLVIQADPPDDAKTYVHRAGRTGRAGRDGAVLTVIPRTRQKRTRELFEQIGIEPDSFGDFAPGDRF